MSDKCPKCDKKAYFAERLTFQNHYWHKVCFKCTSCNKRINTAAEASDNDGKPYCKSCYGKVFGPKGYGYHGGSGAGVMRAANDVVVESTKAEDESKEALAEKQQKLNVSYLKENEQAPPSVQFGWGKQERSGYDQGKKQQEEANERRTKKDNRFGGSPKCPVCGKSVFFAEKIAALGESFHKRCFKCTDCGKLMNTSGDAVDGQGKVYCKGCYAKNFGPKGIGYGVMADTGIDRSKLDKDL